MTLGNLYSHLVRVMLSVCIQASHIHNNFSQVGYIQYMTNFCMIRYKKPMEFAVINIKRLKTSLFLVDVRNKRMEYTI